MTTPEWQWNEMRQVGTDYADVAEVETYDRRMADFRDVAKENQSVLEMLNLSAGSAVLEIGCGTGRFARAAAAAGHRVTAVDVSDIMLKYLRRKANEEGLAEIATRHAGFLTLDFPPESFDAVVSGAALHHLPDVWKLAALRNIARILIAKGQLVLGDVVFHASDSDLESCLELFVNSSTQAIRPGVVAHVREEYSTFDWIMEGLLGLAGFDILRTEQPHESFVVYHCRKQTASKKARAE